MVATLEGLADQFTVVATPGSAATAALICTVVG
jgi:hypothetical protein